MDRLDPEERPLPALEWVMHSAVAGVLVGLVAVLRAVGNVPLDPSQTPLSLSLLGVFAISVRLFLLHVVPLTTTMAWLCRKLRRPVAPWLVLTVVFGLGWVDTVVHGDGLRGHAQYNAILLGLLLAVPLGLALFVRYGLATSVVPARFQRSAVLLLLAACVFVQLRMFSYYVQFHAYLLAFIGALLMWLLWGLRGQSWWQPVQRVALVVVGISILSPLANVDVMGRHAAEVVRISGGLSNLPTVRVFGSGPDPLYACVEEWPPAREVEFEAEFAQRTEAIGQVRRGKSVLLVVLESVRGDYWSEPQLSPAFQGWKRHGVYFPSGIAQYPATPLAYGAMFTSQPPSVLALSDTWKVDRPFDDIAPQFDRLILSQPRNPWFSRSAISSFFVPATADVHRHKSAAQGLGYLRRELERVGAGESFFAWTHLYEPHHPYTFREDYDRGGRHAKDRAYRSQIAYVDEQLGQFMEWFFAQPMAAETMVVVLADHGQGMGDLVMGQPFFGHHVHVHTSLSRVPMFFAAPGLPVDAIEQGLAVTQLDVLPTMHDFLGIPVRPHRLLQGMSVFDVLHRRPEREIVTESFAVRGAEFFQMLEASPEEMTCDARLARYAGMRQSGHQYPPKFALRVGDYKLNYDRALRQHLLYNVREDPGEAHNLVSVEPVILADMKMRKQRWIARQNWTIDRLNKQGHQGIAQSP